jgi:glucose/arabinose dehydrogenase
MKQQDLRYVLVLAAFAAACGGGGGQNPPGSSNPGSGDAGRITGNERLGWTQTAGEIDNLSSLRYAAYVDGNRLGLPDVSCSSSGGGLACTSRLPAMSAGTHTIELVSFVMDGDNTIESPRSAGLTVTLAGATAGVENATTLRTSSAVPTGLTTSDGVTLGVQLVRDGLEMPSALAFTPDGRIFVGERQGRVRVLEGGTVESAPTQLDDNIAVHGNDGGLLGLALDPGFARTHLVYALYTVAGRDGDITFRLARFRETAGVFGERAVLLDGVPASPLAVGGISIGPDGKLYSAFDDGGDPATAAAAGSYNGKILRLNGDGTTPADQSASNPVFSAGYQSPRSLEWQPSSGTLWVADDRRTDDSLVILDGSSSPRASGGAVVRTRIPLPQRVDSLAFYRGDLLPQFRGNLFAVGQGGQLMRLRFDQRSATRVESTERLSLGDGIAPRLVAVGADGAVYVGTEQAIFRISPSR